MPRDFTQILGPLHLCWFLAVASWVTWFFSSWERKKLSKFTKWQSFSLKKTQEFLCQLSGSSKHQFTNAVVVTSYDNEKNVKRQQVKLIPGLIHKMRQTPQVPPRFDPRFSDIWMSSFITFWKINYIIGLLYWQQKNPYKISLVGTIRFSFFHISVKVNRRFCRCHEEIGFSLKISHIRLWSLHLRNLKLGNDLKCFNIGK